jgi:hypothetical protein
MSNATKHNDLPWYMTRSRFGLARLPLTAIFVCATFIVSCGGSGGGGDDAGGIDPPTDPPLWCGPEPIPSGSNWQLVAGFPVCYDSGAGLFPLGPQHGITLGNVDSNPDLEILIAATATADHQSLFIFEHTGDLIAGWPPPDFPKGTAPFVLARLTNATAGDAIFAGTHAINPDTGENYLTAATVDTGILVGWPRVAANYVDVYPAAFDADGDGFDEIFTDEEDWSIHVYKANGDPLNGWPTDSFLCSRADPLSGGQQVGSFAFGDIDQDGQSEVVAVSRSPNGQDTNCLMAFNMDGTAVEGFPISAPGTRRDMTITLGDVDGDGNLEIVYPFDRRSSPEVQQPKVLIYSGNGTLEREIQLSGQLLYSAPASVLADLDGDGFPEIVLLAEGTLNVVHGDGTPLPGFPVEFSEETSGGGVPSLQNCGAVIGDIDGDQSPDILFCARDIGTAKLWAYDRFGSPLPDSPLLLTLSGLPRGPAIGDVDNDGRNEIAVATTNTIWLLHYGSNLPSGPILWGEWGRDSRNTNRYP